MPCHFLLSGLETEIKKSTLNDFENNFPDKVLNLDDAEVLNNTGTRYAQHN